jgi:hypothetical protein
MIRITPNQVEWLFCNEPETQHDIQYPKDRRGESQTWNGFTQTDLELSSKRVFDYYLTTETYNALPEEFKQLADGNQ